MSFLTTFEITISQLGIREDVGLRQSRKPTSSPSNLTQISVILNVVKNLKIIVGQFLVLSF